MSCFIIFILFISSFDSFCSARREFSLQTGSSVTIPCSYDRKYIRHKKYWCYGSTFIYCTIQAHANDKQGKVTATDNPAESFFTVTMNNLQTQNTGQYWCAVEIDGAPDDRIESLYITVKSDPDLSVTESRVSGIEGGSVAIRCQYSAAYQNTQKQWCRFKDKVCNTFSRTDTFQNSAVNLSDDGRRSLSVQMSGLNKSDAGWYWCSAGNLQVPVHIEVNNSTASPNVATNEDSNIDQQEDKSVHEIISLWLPVAVGLGLLVILVSLVGYMLRKTCKKENQTRTRDTAAHTGSQSNHPQPPSAPDHEDVTYTSVFSATHNHASSLTAKEDEVTYGNVHYPGIRDDVTYSTVVLE